MSVANEFEFDVSDNDDDDNQPLNSTNKWNPCLRRFQNLAIYPLLELS